MDTASRKLLWLKVWVSNHDPQLIGKWYLEHLYETKIISAMLRVDKGAETGTMATMHAFLRRHHNDMDPHKTVICGPSTSNQVWKCSVYFLSKLKLVEIELGTIYLARTVGREKAIGGQDLPLPPASCMPPTPSTPYIQNKNLT